MDAEHYKGLSQAWMRVRDDAAIRVAIITGAGEKSFSSGADIKSFLTAPAGLDEMWLTQRDQLLNRGLEVWKPVIAAVNGYCLAGGMTLLLGTDIRIAAEHATFNIAEVKRGILPGNGGTQRILDQLPYAIGMELLLTGDCDRCAEGAALRPDQQGGAEREADGDARATTRRRSPRMRRSPCRPPRKWRCARARWTAPPACVSRR